MIKRMLILALISVFSLLLPAGVVSAQSPNDFAIESFTADYYLDQNDRQVSSMTVQETIVALFPNFDQNHGILRSIPKKYQDHTLGLKIVSVTDEENQPYKYTTYGQNDNEVLKIGDANTYAHGRTTYKITYTLKEVISFEDTHDEFYWDINGDGWSQVFGEVTARIHIPSDLALSLQERQLCFSGKFGETRSNCTISRKRENGDTIITSTASRLTGYETLTVAIAFDKGTFAPDKTRELFATVLIILIIASAVVPPVLTFIIVYKKWKRHGRDPKGRGIIVPQYLPPKNFNAVLADMVMNEKLSNRAISATVIELATKKYITIYDLDKKPRDFELELIHNPTGLDAEQYKVLTMFFGSSPSVGDKVKLSSLKSTMYKDVKKLADSASSRVFNLGYFVSDPHRARQRFIGAGTLMLIIGFLLLFTFFATALGIGLIISSIIAFVGSQAMPARTLKGVEMRDYFKGTEDYIKLAEVERIKYLQSPEGAKQFGDPKDDKTKIKLFEKLLPYAMIFGLEKKWAEEFKHLYSEPPDWYHGNWSTFNTAHLSSSLHNFSTTTGATFSPPSSSGSSGFSGGGGSSGGGGGGGGGGGW